MALIKCPDCKNDVSDTAPACPRCGRQIAAVTIERTSKGIKGTLLVSSIGFVLGLALLFTRGAAFGILLAFVSGVVYLGAGVLSWWRHD